MNLGGAAGRRLDSGRLLDATPATYHASVGVEENALTGGPLMPERRPAVPGLYSVDGGDPPSLEGRRCLDCGYVFFPPHAFGCEVCGALPDRTEPVKLAGVGVLPRSPPCTHLSQLYGRATMTISAHQAANLPYEPASTSRRSSATIAAGRTGGRCTTSP